MVLWLSPKVFEDALLPVALHVIPIINHTVSDGIVDAVGLGVGHGFIADMEIEILDAALGGEVG